jgi:hypothetical protein
MATVITAGNATNGLSLTPDNIGSFEFKTGTGAGTTALTLTTSQVVMFAGAASVPGNLSFNSGYGSAAVAYGCRAWVNFNGQSTVTIRASGNVTSITDNGVGDYTVNFTTAMPDINYAYCGSHSSASAGVSSFALNNIGATAPTTTAARVTTYVSGSNVDPLYVNIAFFR